MPIIVSGEKLMRKNKVNLEIKIEELEKRIKELEQKPNISIFPNQPYNPPVPQQNPWYPHPIYPIVNW